MPLSLFELKDRAIRFAQEWPTAADERADAQAFWIDFFHVFDIKRRRVASFEVPIKKADDPLTMPPALVRAHAAPDRAVDLCYRPAAFATELARLEFLFAAYRSLPAPLLPPPAKVRKATKT